MLTFKVHFMRICYAIPSIAATRWVCRKVWFILGSVRLDWRVIEGWILTGDDRTMLVSMQAHSEPTETRSATRNSKGIFGVIQNLPCSMSHHAPLQPPTLSLPFLPPCSAGKVWIFASFAPLRAQGFPVAAFCSFPLRNQHCKAFAGRAKPTTKHHDPRERVPETGQLLVFYNPNGPQNAPWGSCHHIWCWARYGSAPVTHRKTCHQCRCPTGFDLPSSSVQSQSTKVCGRDMTSLCQPRALPEGCTFLPLIGTAGITVAQDDSAEAVSRPGFYRPPAVACTTELCTSRLGAKNQGESYIKFS